MGEKAAAPRVHDLALFERLFLRARGREPALRSGSMFGCPAAFVGRKLAFCVFGSEIGAKVPEPTAKALLARGVAQSFQPYGKRKMREWVAMVEPLDDAVVDGLLESAIAYARDLNQSSQAAKPPSRRRQGG